MLAPPHRLTDDTKFLLVAFLALAILGLFLVALHA
jgi:hypothetical protein